MDTPDAPGVPAPRDEPTVPIAPAPQEVPASASVPPPPAPPPRRRSPLILALAVGGVAVVAAGVVLGVVLTGGSSKPAQSHGPSHPAASGPPTIADLTATAIGPSEIDLQWPAATGDVLLYYVYRNGKLLMTEPGTITSYKDEGVQPGHEYIYAIQASSPSGLKSAQVRTTATSFPPPPLATARLSGQFVVHATFVSENFTNHRVGEKQTFAWQFTPQCSTGVCAVRVNLFAPHQSPIVLTRKGATYSGKGTATLITCGSTRLTTTLTFTLHVTRGAFSGGVWEATAIAGTYTQYAPPTFTCQSGSSTETFTAALQS